MRIIKNKDNITSENTDENENEVYIYFKGNISVIQKNINLYLVHYYILLRRQSLI